MQNPFRYFNNSPEVIRSAVMLYVRYPLSLRQVEDLLFDGASTFAMRPCGTGGTALVRSLPPRSGNAVFVMDPIRCGAGILMRCSSASTVRHITYGAPLTMKAKCLRSMPRNGGIVKPRLGF